MAVALGGVEFVLPDTREQFKKLSVLIAASGVDMIGFAMILPLLPFYALELDASPLTIGLMFSSFSVAQLLSAPVWGRVSDLYGRRPALLIGLTASALAYLVFAVANAVWLLFASRLIQGAGGGTTGVAHAYVADTVRPEHRARALGLLSAATSVGIMLGPVIGSFAAHFGREAPGLVAAVLCAVNIGFAWKWLPESKPSLPAGGVPERRPVWAAAWSIVRRPNAAVPRLVWVYSVGMLAFSALTSILSLYLGAEFGFTEKTIGYVFLYIGLLSVIIRSLCLGPIVDRVGEMWAMRSGTLVLIAGLVAYPFAGSLVSLAAVMPLVPLGTALLFPSTTALMSRASDKSEVGVTMGIAQTYGGIARMIAPVIATFVYQRFGHTVPFYVAAAFVALVGILAFRVAQDPPEARF
jgi:MFS family permease